MKLRGLRFLTVACLIACLTIASFPVQATEPPQGKETFTFGKADLDLLEQANLLDVKLDKEGLVYNDRELEDYINRIGQSLLPLSAPPEHVTWRFRVLRDPLGNAFALPNGSIYVNSGLLALFENESQLAGVLAHEITHVRNWHSYLTNRSVRKKALTINLLALVSAFTPYNTVGTVITLVAAVSQQLLVFSMFGYSRELEREADAYAANRLVESKYDSRELAAAFTLMKKDFEGENFEAKMLYRDHDKLDDRIKDVNQIVGNRSVLSADEVKAQRERYFAATEKVARHNTQLAIDARRFRTAIAMSEKLVAGHPSAENLAVLADAYRLTGPRSATLTEEERSGKGKKEMQKLRQKMTLNEEENTLLATPIGQATRLDNQRKAEELYQKALALDAANAKAHLGLGLLYETMGKPQKAAAELRRFLELEPGSVERQRIQRRIEALEKSGAENSTGSGSDRLKK